MEPNELERQPPPPLPSQGYQFPQPPKPSLGQKIKKALGPFGVVLVLIGKFFAKLKLILLPALKFLPILLKTGGTMIISIWAYALAWGWWFALGFVILLFVHECGHLLVAKRLGLKVSAPVFIPFMGAFILLKEAPRNAWIESQVGIGGPVLGTLGAGVCEVIYLITGNPIFAALAYTGFFLNLFNLSPVGFLDGGRIVTALSPWLWIVGFVILTVMTILHFNFLLLMILILSLPRIFFLFRDKSEAEQRYYEVTPSQRWTMATMYFGLIALLVLGMKISEVSHKTLQVQ